MQDFAIAFPAGLLTFLSPCILPLVPVYIANLAGASSLETQVSHWRPFLHSLCFVAGFSLVLIGLGAIVGLLGGAVPAGILRIVAGSLIVAFGLFIIVAPRVSWLNYEIRLSRLAGKNTGYLRSVLLGAVFSLGWTPCMGPILVAMLSVAWSSQDVLRGVYLLGMYSLGLGVPFIAAGLALGRITPILRWLSRRSNIISLVSGLLLITIGVLVLTNNLGLLQFGL